MLIIHCGSGILMRKVATVPAVISCSALTSLNLLGSQADRESDILFFSQLSEIVFCKYQSNFNYKYIICKKKLNSCNPNVIMWFIFTPYLNSTSQSLLPFSRKLEYFSTPNESLLSVCVCGDLTSLSHAWYKL